MGRALAILMFAAVAAPALARADCEVAGVASLERLRVRIPGEPLRTLSVTDLPIAVRPGNGNAYRDVRVLAPLAFTVRSDAAVPWTVPHAGAFAGGMLWLTPAADIEEVRVGDEPDELSVRVQVDANVWISRLHLPCSALALGQGEGGASTPGWATRGGPRWAVRGEDVWLRNEPGSGPSIRVDAPEGLTLVELERRGPWIRVAARFGSGAALRGWARQNDLEAAPRAEEEPSTFRRALLVAPVPHCARRPPRRGEYVGPAHVHSGAEVRVDPDGPVWATVSEPAVLTVSWRMGSRWVQIVHVPGLRGDGRCPEVLEHAWVRRDSVSLQGEAASASASRPRTPGEEAARVEGTLSSRRGARGGTTRGAREPVPGADDSSDPAPS